MAKIQGLVGGLSGKMGNAVFRQRYGETVVSQYQPVVSNPNTPAQQNARAAFKLITQLSAIMAPAYGSMSVVERPARHGRNPRTGFVAKNYNLIEVDPGTGDAERVTIPMEQLQLTESFRPAPSLTNRSTSQSLNISATNAPAGTASIRFVVLEYIDVNGGSQAAIRNIVDVPYDDGKAILEEQATAGEKLTVLTYALIPSANARAKVDFDNIHTPADDNFISAVELDKMVRDGDMTMTMTSGVNVTIPSA